MCLSYQKEVGSMQMQYKFITQTGRQIQIIDRVQSKKKNPGKGQTIGEQHEQGEIHQ